MMIIGGRGGAEGCLRRNPYLALKNVSCDCRGGPLVLRGCLPTYSLEPVAQEVVAQLVGGRRRQGVDLVAIVAQGAGGADRKLLLGVRVASDRGEALLDGGTDFFCGVGRGAVLVGFCVAVHSDSDGGAVKC
jgi:hypothetical protein